MTDLAVATRRGTSNSNERGSSEDRRRRKLWLIETYRANVDVVLYTMFNGMEYDVLDVIVVALGSGEAACRCYRCGELLTFESVTVDRIIPGCMGGKYRRNNIRPACGDCNSETGGALACLPKGRRR